MSRPIADKQEHPNSIVKFRGKRGWSITQLAAVSRIDEWTCRMLETGQMQMHAGHMQRFSTVFDCTAEELIAPCRSQRNPQLARGRRLKNLDKGRGGSRWAGKLPIPPNAHPLVREMFELMNKHKIMITRIAEASGVGRAAISDWRYRTKPHLESFEAALGVMGYKLKIEPIEDDEVE